MEKSIYKLKNLIYDLQYYLNSEDTNEILKSTSEIKDICNVIENGLKSAGIEIDVEDVQINLAADILNVIEFVYLPFDYALEEDYEYIERFSERRFTNLKASDSLRAHDEFWSQHETVSGNIYGSVPVEYLNSQNVKKLESYGWEKIEVEIIAFKDKNLLKKDVMDYCRRNFYRYIIVIEQDTKDFLILNYKINIDGVYK